MGEILTQADVERQLSPSTIAQLFTNPGEDHIDAEALEDCIERAEGEVFSWLLGDIDITSPTFQKYDRLLRAAAGDFFKVFAFERHPEYVKTFGEDPRSLALYKRAQDRMARIQAATQQLPDQKTPVAQNQGAIIRGGGPRMITTGPDGRHNGAGY